MCSLCLGLFHALILCAGEGLDARVGVWQGWSERLRWRGGFHDGFWNVALRRWLCDDMHVAVCYC